MTNRVLSDAIALNLTIVGREHSPYIVVQCAMCSCSVVVDGEFPSLVLHVTHVSVRRVLHTELERSRNLVDKILGPLVVPVHADFEGAVEETEVETDTGLLRSLPAGVQVRNGIEISTSHLVGQILTENNRPIVCKKLSLGYIRREKVHVADLTPTCSEFHEVHDILHSRVCVEVLGAEFP